MVQGYHLWEFAQNTKNEDIDEFPVGPNYDGTINSFRTPGMRSIFILYGRPAVAASIVIANVWLAIVGLASVVRAQATDEAPSDRPPHTYYGDPSCGKIVSAWETNTGDKYVYEAWVLGFISGAGYEGAENNHLDHDGIMLWVRQYCVAHPLLHSHDAVEALLETLK